MVEHNKTELSRGSLYHVDGVSGQNKVSRFKTIITTITLPAAAAAMPTALLSSPHDMAKEEEEQEEEERECC